jgi:hypothetical protein
LTSSLAVIPANLSQQQEGAKEPMTPGTCGRISGDTLNQLDLFDAFLKTSKDTSRLDCPASLAIWKKMVIDQRGEYSQRVKLAHHTREKESTSWPTATVFDVTGGSYPTQLVNGQWRSKHSKNQDSPWYGAKLKDAVETAERMWPTPAARDYKGAVLPETLKAKNRNPMTNTLPDAVQHKSGRGHLNPEWVEWLMGVPTGWTELDF